jgi:hypothetical protein
MKDATSGPAGTKGNRGFAGKRSGGSVIGSTPPGD